MAQSAITKYTKRIINLIISRCVTKVVNLLFNKATKSGTKRKSTSSSKKSGTTTKTVVTTTTTTTRKK
ncbi:MAG: hypothetical protein J6T06_13495 [Victivallales bacterium]|nr:hypothetical protein [Victivallales bacterium]